MSELTYTTSRDYERLADLVEAGWGITNGAGTTFSCIRYDREDGSQSRVYWIDYGEEADHQKTREEFIAECQHRFIEFLDPASQQITGETSDGYHTFNELYHHRAILFAALCRCYPCRAWKSRQHHDGPMYEGMFICGICTEDGDATYHYDIDPYWEMFNCEEMERAPEWDGHTPEIALERLNGLRPAQEQLAARIEELEVALETAYERMLELRGNYPYRQSDVDRLSREIAEVEAVMKGKRS